MSKRVIKATGLLIVFALAASCGPGLAGDAPIAPTQTPARVESAETQKEDGSAQPRCAPERLRRGDTLTVELAAPHGGYLAVVNPQKKYFFLTSEDAGALSADRKAGADPLLSVAEFAKMSRLSIDTSRAKAVDWSREWPRGEGKSENIFSQTGSYEVLVGSESIDQEGAPYDFKCRVHYEAEPR